MSRRMTIRASAEIPNVNYPADDVTGNDDTDIADEDNYPYDAPLAVLTSEDNPHEARPDGVGAPGNTFSVNYWFIEFARVQLGTTWYRISGDCPWRFYVRMENFQLDEPVVGIDLNNDGDTLDANLEIWADSAGIGDPPNSERALDNAGLGSAP
jgi:hypothetical protein